MKSGLEMLKSLKSSRQLSDITGQWQTWTPTITWIGSIPVTISAVSRYKVIGKTVLFIIKVEAADGNGSTGMVVSMPIDPKTQNAEPACAFNQRIGSTYTSRSAFIRDDGSNNNIRCYTSTLTGGSSFGGQISGVYEIE